MFDATSKHRSQTLRGVPWLIGPQRVDEFVATYWGKRVMHVSRSDPSFFRDILTLDDLDAIMASSLPEEEPNANLPFIVVDNSKHAEPTQKATRYSDRYPRGSTLLTRYYDRYCRGSTFFFNSIQKHWRPIAELCQGLSEFFRCKVQGNVFLTPKNAKGFSAHYDTSDGFVLQLHGEKTWRFRGVGHKHPLPRHRLPGALDPAKLPKGFEVTLRPGDVLYVPRGFVHEASTTATSSMHITLSVFSLVVEDLLLEAVRRLADRMVDLRTPLPLASGAGERAAMKTRLRRALGQLDESTLARAQSSLFARRIEEAWPIPRGRFEAFENIADLGPTSVVEKRCGTPCSVAVDADAATIRFPGSSLPMPSVVAPALRFIRDHDSFVVRDLPGDLSLGAKLALVRCLIEKGLLEATPNAPRAQSPRRGSRRRREG